MAAMSASWLASVAPSSSCCSFLRGAGGWRRVAARSQEGRRWEMVGPRASLGCRCVLDRQWDRHRDGKAGQIRGEARYVDAGRQKAEAWIQASRSSRWGRGRRGEVVMKTFCARGHRGGDVRRKHSGGRNRTTKQTLGA